MLSLFKRKPDPSQAARDLSAHVRRHYEQRRRDTTDELRAKLGLPEWKWRPMK